MHPLPRRSSRSRRKGMFFKEPLECYKEQNGCGRTAGSTKFKLLTEESRYVDTQKIEIQESPEGLRGGAQPERLTGFLEDDLAGNGLAWRQGSHERHPAFGAEGRAQKSTLFDINLDVLSVEFKTQEYEEVDITEEDEDGIISEAATPRTSSRRSSGRSRRPSTATTRSRSRSPCSCSAASHKSLDDGTKIRGDIHILLVGDPGVAKCVTGDAR